MKDLEKRARELGIYAEDDTWDNRELGADEAHAETDKGVRIMTDKFDPNATPHFDWLCSELNGCRDEFVLHRLSCELPTMERRALTAEEKLKIVFTNFVAYQGKHKSVDVATLLNNIEREFELVGLNDTCSTKAEEMCK